MKDEMTRLVQQMVEQERKRSQLGVPIETPIELVGIPCSELPEGTSDEPLAREWNVYRNEVVRLLADGQQGRYVLIWGEEIIGIFDGWVPARQAGLKRFGKEPFFVHEIRAAEPHMHIRGINRPWPD